MGPRDRKDRCLFAVRAASLSASQESQFQNWTKLVSVLEENRSGRAHLPLPPRPQFDLLEMDRLERPLVNLPLLLDPSSYVPDTVDLTDDAQARKYWLTCFEEALDGVRGVVCRTRGPMLRSEGGERGDVGFPEASLAGRLGGRLLFPGPQCSSWWVVRTVSWDAEPGRHTSCK